jgi:hypothetical protein
MYEDYKQVYDADPKTGEYIIDVKLDRFFDFYHPWDNSKFDRRDMHPELIDYLEDCSKEIPFSEGIAVRFEIESEEKSAEQEQKLEGSFRYYFRYLIRTYKQQRTREYRHTAFLAILALVLLFIANIVDTFLTENAFSLTVIEGIFVGGWVFMWEAVYALGFHRPGERQKMKEAVRLLDAPLFFVYPSE